MIKKNKKSCLICAVAAHVTFRTISMVKTVVKTMSA